MHYHKDRRKEYFFKKKFISLTLKNASLYNMNQFTTWIYSKCCFNNKNSLTQN
jgi:hypothetical protein